MPGKTFNRALVAVVLSVLCGIGGIRPAAAVSSLPPAPHGPKGGVPTVSGTISYRERRDLPPKAVVHVDLIDASARRPHDPMLGRQTIWPAGARLPVTFWIEYDPSRIDPDHVYIVRARILEGEKVLYRNTTTYYVLTRGAPSAVDIVVTPVR